MVLGGVEFSLVNGGEVSEHSVTRSAEMYKYYGSADTVRSAQM